MLRLTDEQFIARLRRSQRHRRWLGIGMMVIGLACTAAVCLFTIHMHRRTMALLSDLNHNLAATTQQTLQALDAGQMNVGFAFGAACTVALCGAFSVVLCGVMILVPMRKDRLLLTLWDRQATDKAV